MLSGFDLAAAGYDVSFTHTAIGKLQRKRVYHYLLKFVFDQKKQNILEVNCGTGQDALWLAKYGTKILATDVSEKMLEKAISKSQNHDNVNFEVLDLNNFEAFRPETKFDFIFSNFGGLNCIDPDTFKKFLQKAADKMLPKAQMALVIMPKKCLWECSYFLLKGKLKNMGRRSRKGPLKVNVDGQMVNTWYYSPKEIKSFVGPMYQVIGVKPIGLFVPPSYLNRFFKNKKTALNLFGWLDRKLDRFDFLGPYSDHFIIILERI